MGRLPPGMASGPFQMPANSGLPEDATCPAAPVASNQHPNTHTPATQQTLCSIIFYTKPRLTIVVGGAFYSTYDKYQSVSSV